jgi:predicted metal-dependent peptidase
MSSTSIVDLYKNCQKLQRQIVSLNLNGYEALNHPDLALLSDQFKQILSFAETHLVSAHDVFYGVMLLNFENRVDWTIRGPIDTVFTKSHFLLLFNPLFIFQYEYFEFIALLVSEMLTIVYEHPIFFAENNQQQSKRTHRLLEVSSQASIHAMLISDIQISLDPKKNMKIPSDFFSSEMIRKHYRTKALKPREDIGYYFQILDYNSKFLQKPKEDRLSDASLIATPKNDQGKEIHQWYFPESNGLPMMQDAIKHLVVGTFQQLDAVNASQVSGAIREQLIKIMKAPKIAWTTFLKKYLGTIPSGHRSTKMRLNRRQPLRSDLSGTLSHRLIELVIALDTSGSMSTKDIQHCLDEMYYITKHYRTRITIIECDAIIQRVYQVNDLRQVKPEVLGRGGTSFIPVINHINQKRSYQNALLIYFTDGFGDNEIPKPMTYRNLWVVLNNKTNLTVKEPYGEVITLEH